MNEETEQAEVVETEVVEEQEQTPEPFQALTLDQMEAQLKAAGRFPQPTIQAPAQEVEFIEGTNIPKPDGFDTWGVDRSAAYIAQQTQAQFFQVQTAASRAARDIEKQAEPWYIDSLREVIDDCDPRFLASLTTEQKSQLVNMAIGKAVQSGKTPTPASKPVPGASPVSTKAPSQSVAASEVDQVLQGIRDAGYGKVADSPKIRELLSR